MKQTLSFHVTMLSQDFGSSCILNHQFDTPTNAVVTEDRLVLVIDQTEAQVNVDILHWVSAYENTDDSRMI